nr:integrase, catalytic region, zinc finger, CCHC-type, peptidase aspartic, catalytic [Tanacetum cinerariifolium]
MYDIDVEPIPPRLRNNREVHLDCLKHLKESVATLCEIVEEAKFERPLDRSVASACLYTKHSQELLEYPTRRIFTLGEQCPLTRFTHRKVVPTKKPENVSTSKSVITENSSYTSQKPLTRYQRRNKQNKAVPAGIPTPTDAAMQSTVTYANQLDSNHNWGSNFPNSPSLSVFKYRSYRLSFVRFENDHFGAIMGYGDYVIGDSVISRVYYVEGLGHNLFFVRQFCDSDLEVAFRKHPCYVRNTNGVELIKGSHGSNLYNISVEYMMKSSPICLLSKASKTKSWLWHRRLNHLNFGTINDLARNDLISLGLVPNLVPAAPYILPTNKDLEILFQPMFDEYLEPPHVDRQVSPAPAVPVHVNLAGTPSSTAIDQDAHSLSHSPSSLTLQSLCLHQGVAAESTLMDENLFATVDKDPFINTVASDPTSAESS